MGNYNVSVTTYITRNIIIIFEWPIIIILEWPNANEKENFWILMIFVGSASEGWRNFRFLRKFSIFCQVLRSWKIWCIWVDKSLMTFIAIKLKRSNPSFGKDLGGCSRIPILILILIIVNLYLKIFLNEILF